MIQSEDYKRGYQDTLAHIRNEIEQPQILQCDCVECSLYDGFGQCLEHGDMLKDNCEDFTQIED